MTPSGIALRDLRVGCCAPPGRLLGVARGYRVTSLVVLLLFLVPFAVGQIRIALFPLESPLHRHEHAPP